MASIGGIYEVVIRVRDPERAERFYIQTLGLEVGLRVRERGMTFLRAGGERGMLVLQHDDGDWPSQHYAFTVAADDMDSLVADLRGHGVEVSEPVRHDWMPARSAYFADPDGHQLEFCAPL